MLLHELYNHYFILRVLSLCVENFRKIYNGSGHSNIKDSFKMKILKFTDIFSSYFGYKYQDLAIERKTSICNCEIFMVKDIRNKFFRLSGFDTGCLEADEDINSSRRIRYTGLAVEYYYKIIIETGFSDLTGVVWRMIS